MFDKPLSIHKTNTMSCTVYTATRGFVVLESETDNILFHGFNDWGDILFRTEPIPGKEYPRFKKLTHADFIGFGGGTPHFFDEILQPKSKMTVLWTKTSPDLFGPKTSADFWDSKRFMIFGTESLEENLETFWDQKSSAIQS